ncbi:MAG: pyrimidine 5'-nucleotidase [Pseudomonadota bacterium]
MRDSIDTWIFDLDDTLYPAHLGLVGQINKRMTDFVMRELGLDRPAADRWRDRAWRDHGITLHALMAERQTDPAVFLAETHDIDYAMLAPDPALTDTIAALPGRRVVHTNGARSHALRVLEKLEIDHLFETVWAIEDAGLIAKPRPEATANLLTSLAVDPARAAMIEDSPGNLRPAKVAGLRTVWVTPQPPARPPDHIDHITSDLAQFLDRL